MTVVLKKENGEVLLENLKEAQGFMGRFKGLMGKTSLPDNEGLRITPCNSIHCFFMRMNIDVLFLDENLCVVHTIFDMKPWRISKVIRGAKSVVEAESGVFQGKVKVGDCLSIGT
ncbi:DUF192 domain-containing protein [Proteiniclasticum ruminis]|uniref:DUF192 domain-containing protein n=1 Tax=Proteiniclasticum ruminis TaxID=398199 RepID=A0A1I5D7L7_9CLOT|nr:DUF192 domain-containing protein [Proteiniclasticum ruminis]SFN95106.1 hypothetical protein SAMN04488695_10883 [Proteiniclasticum ruminis]